MPYLYVAATKGSYPKLKEVADCLTDGSIQAAPWPDGALLLHVPLDHELPIAHQLLLDNGLTILQR